MSLTRASFCLFLPIDSVWVYVFTLLTCLIAKSIPEPTHFNFDNGVVLQKVGIHLQNYMVSQHRRPLFNIVDSNIFIYCN
jgi:hypothetical protein